MISPRIDLHLHLLPGIDDGPPTLERAIDLARGLVELGYRRVCCTPHHWRGMWLPEASQLAAAHATLEAGLAAAGLPLQVELGAEHRLDDHFIEQLRARALRCLGRGSAVLIELPDGDPPAQLDGLLFELQTEGYQPILAHIERYPALAGKPARLEALRERGALLQVCLTSLGGKMGWLTSRRAAALLSADLIDLVSSDAHSQPEIARYLVPALTKLERLVSPARAEELTSTTPARLLEAAGPGEDAEVAR